MNKERNVEEIRRLLSKDNWENEDIVYLMSLYRLLLEEEKIKEQFKYLNLYCNWILHTEISGSATAYKILEYIADAFYVHSKEPNSSLWINSAIVVGLSFHKLQADILNLGQDYNISESSKLSNMNMWKRIGTKMIQVLADKPLKFPEPITNKKVKEIYDSIMAKAKELGGKEMSGVIGVQFKDEKFSEPHKGTPGFDGPHVEVFTQHSVKIGYKMFGSFQFVTEEQVNKALAKLANPVKI